MTQKTMVSKIHGTRDRPITSKKNVVSAMNSRFFLVRPMTFKNRE